MNFEELKEKLKKKLKETKEISKKEIPQSIRIYIPLLIVLLAFFPATTYLTLTILLILLFIISIILISFFSETDILFLPSLFPVIIVVVLMLVCHYIGSPNYFQLARKIQYGYIVITAFFTISTIIACVIGNASKTYPQLFLSSGVLIATFFFIIPFLITSLKPYSICMQLPIISHHCNPIEINVKGPETINVPISGGISLEFIPSKTLYAGEPFEYTFTLRNYYEDVIDFKIEKSYITSTYGSDVRFVYPFKQRIYSLGKNQFYQDGVLIDPSQLKAEAVEVCPYYELEVGEGVECARDKPCSSEKEACIKLGYGDCRCVDWMRATCSGAKLKLGMKIQHTGFFVSNASQYYSSVNVPPMPAPKLTQGPFSMTIQFQPNPYIGPLHYYRNDTSLYITFKNTESGGIVIDYLNITPLSTVITTIDKERNMKLIENITMEKIWCRDMAGMFLASNTEITKLVCKFTPPHVVVRLIDVVTNETIELNNVSFDRIYYYCNKIKMKEEIGEEESEKKEGYIFWSNYWENIYKSIKESGLCEILKKEEDAEEKKIVENSLRFVSVYIGVNYTRTTTFESSSITPWTRTEECMNLKEGI